MIHVMQKTSVCVVIVSHKVKVSQNALCSVRFLFFFNNFKFLHCLAVQLILFIIYGNQYLCVVKGAK